MPSRSGQRPAENAPPEAWLIWQARTARIPRMSQRVAARLAAISAQTWGNVERGRRPGGDPRIARGEAETVAAMAAVVGVTAAQLREAGREDAAELLVDLLERPPSYRHRDAISGVVEEVTAIAGWDHQKASRLRQMISDMFDDDPPPGADEAGRASVLSRGA